MVFTDADLAVRSRPIANRGRSKRPLILATVAIYLLSAFNLAHLSAEPAHIWISTSNVAPSGPPQTQAQVASIDSIEGSTRILHIWAQPALGKTLQNFSLNLWANNASVVSLPRDETTQLAIPGSVVVYNPIVTGTKTRFQNIRDSFPHFDSNGIRISDGIRVETESVFPPNPYPYRINGMKGFTFDGGNPGIGGDTCGIDTSCTMVGNRPAWLIASVEAKVGSVGAAEFFLQVGDRGMNYSFFQPSKNLSVVFGAADGTEYKGSDLEMPAHPGDETPDFVLRAASPSAVTPIQSQTGNISWDQLAGGVAPTGLNDVTISGGLVTVTGAQQANSTAVSGGRLHIGPNSSLASDVAVNSGSISGDGWVGANLNFASAGKLALSSNKPLNVYGTANIAGGSLELAPGYTPPIGQEFAVLSASSGLLGTLNATVGPLSNSNLRLESIRYTTQSIFVTLALAGLPGDYNNDGKVDAADYVVWRKTDGSSTGYNNWRNNFGRTTIALPGDYNTDGKVDTADYVVWRKTDGTQVGYNNWRSNYGRIAGSGAGDVSGVAVVPEPATAGLLFIGIVFVGGLCVSGKRRAMPTSWLKGQTASRGASS